jgi:hypothetical protein
MSAQRPRSPESGRRAHIDGRLRSAKTGLEQMQQLRLRKAVLFDHLVGAGE